MENLSRFKVEREMQERADRYIKINKNFKNSPGTKFVTEKFYSKYERMGDESGDLLILKNKNACLMEKFKNRTPQQKHSLPITENQVYGWLWDKCFVYDKKDRELFCRNRTTDEWMKVEYQVNTVMAKLKIP